ncbi:MAG: short-chain dehydrogenase/reductase [Caulobacter sp.]|nr:short-chain dehydrogenase/reductase [Caulobacter sp.]
MTDNLFDLTGKVALVTGGSRGLGRAIALGFAAAGADLIIASRKLEACEAVAGEIRALGRRALAVQCHVGQWDDLQRLTDQAYEAFGRVDVLVNNAGMSPLAASSLETTEALFDKIVDVNFKGVFRLTALIGSRMAEDGGGSIINVSSMGAAKPRPFIAPYAGAKAALNTISVAFAEEFGGGGVRVNVISPGGFLTDVSGEWANDESLKATVALGRFGRPQEIVSTALYLASDHSSYTTGANIWVNGGGR